MIVSQLIFISFVQAHCNENDIRTALQHLENFLHFNQLPIQLATVETLTYLFDKEWLNDNHNDTAHDLKDFYLTLFEKLNISKLQLLETNDRDTQNRNLCVRLQLYCSIIVKSYLLREKTWYCLAEFCCMNGVNNGKSDYLFILLPFS